MIVQDFINVAGFHYLLQRKDIKENVNLSFPHWQILFIFHIFATCIAHHISTQL